jgi:hypothetical protein
MASTVETKRMPGNAITLNWIDFDVVRIAPTNACQRPVVPIAGTVVGNVSATFIEIPVACRTTSDSELPVAHNRNPVDV